MAQEDQKVQDLPDITSSSNDQHIMVITDTHLNQLRKEKIGDLIKDFVSADGNNGLKAASDGKLYTADTTNADNIISGTLKTDRLPDSGAAAGTYSFPEEIVIDTKGRIKYAKNGTPGGNNADKDLSNITEEGKSVIRNNSNNNGLLIGQLIYSVFPIDSPCLRSPDGSVIMQDGMYQKSAVYLKELVKLYPQFSKTEEEWQAMKEKYGEVPAIVIDDTAGTIRLPLIVNPVKGVTDLSQLAQVIEAGLPNITAKNVATNYGGLTPPTGAARRSTDNAIVANSAGIQEKYTEIDASLSSPIYGNSDTVQPQQATGCYYIVLATGVEQDFKAIEEYQVNTPYSLLQPIWSDTKLNNLSLLRSSGQANHKAVHKDCYELLLSEYNSGIDETETTGGVEITFRRGADRGFKVTTDKAAYDAILQAEGTAWYYVLDTENEVFYLPHSNGFMQFAQSGAGNYQEAGLPNITTVVDSMLTNGNVPTQNSTIYFGPNKGAPTGPQAQWNNTRTMYFDASFSSPIYGKSDTVQPPSVKGYLYFYVGEVAQNASLVNVGRIEEKLVDKANINADNFTKSGKSLLSGLGAPSERYIDLTLGASGATYTAPANGYVEMNGIPTNANNNNIAISSSEGIAAQSQGNTTGYRVALYIPISKGADFSIGYTNMNINALRFIYAQGEEEQA